MDDDLSFGAWLKRRRKSFDFTQNQLAELVGCSSSAIYKIEAEERRPSRQVAELLAERLEIPADERTAFIRWARGERLPATLPALALKGPALPAPPAGAPVFPSNLPVPMAPMIGRERELAGIEQLLADSNCRLLTLTGPGGIGKTRLALEIAHRRQADFPQGVFFVSLASVADVDFMIPAIANALGLVFYGPEPPLQQLIRALQSRQALLVLDNMEHLLDGAQLISDILLATQQVTFLVTSQKRLELHGEWVFEVQGLPLPDERQPGANQSSSAVRLFLENAQRVKPGFMPTDADHAAISRICQLLEGMPLGILLAATWVRALSCREVVTELEQDLDFLRTSAANIPERQRSLRAVFDHSWELLTGEERQALTSLAVFGGGFRREAAWEIADASIFTISTLVDKSLVRRTPDGCYDLHELTRQFAYKRLEARADRDDLLARHSAYYLDWIASQEKELKSADQKAVMGQFSLAFDDIRQAWKWAVQNRRYDALDRALRALMWFFELKGWFQDGAALFGWAAAELGYAMDEGETRQEAPQVVGRLLTVLSWFALRLGQFERTQQLLDDAGRLLSGQAFSVANAERQAYQGMAAYLTGDYPRAEIALNQAVQTARRVGDLWCAAQALGSLGRTAQLSGNYAQAIDYFEHSLQVWQQLGDVRGKTYAMNFLGNLNAAQGNFSEASNYLEKSLALSLAVDDVFSIGTAYNHLGLLAYAQEEFAGAETYFLQAGARFDEIGEQHSLGWVKSNLGHTQIALNKNAEAHQALTEALVYGWRGQALPLILDALAGLGHLDLRSGDLDAAEEKLSIASQHTVTSQAGRERAIRLLMQVMSQKPGQKFTIPRKLEVVVQEVIRYTDTLPA